MRWEEKGTCFRIICKESSKTHLCLIGAVFCLFGVVLREKFLYTNVCKRLTPVSPICS